MESGKEREVLEELEMGLEMRESDGRTGVANACAIVVEIGLWKKWGLCFSYPFA